MAKPLLAPPLVATATKPFFFASTTTWLELLCTVLGSPTSMVVDSLAIFSCNWGLRKTKCVLCVLCIGMFCSCGEKLMEDRQVFI